jgi:hypothetical protein
LEKLEGGNPDPEDALGTVRKMERRSLDPEDAAGTAVRKMERRSLDPDDAAALIARVERCRDLEDVKSLLKISFSQLQVTFFCLFCFSAKEFSKEEIRY